MDGFFWQRSLRFMIVFLMCNSGYLSRLATAACNGNVARVAMVVRPRMCCVSWPCFIVMFMVRIFYLWADLLRVTLTTMSENSADVNVPNWGNS
mgnify:FL=1